MKLTKLTKLAVMIGLAGSSLGMLNSPAQAFNLTFNEISKVTNTKYAYNFSFKLGYGDSFQALQKKISFTFQSPTSGGAAPVITGQDADAVTNTGALYFEQDGTATGTNPNGENASTQKFISKVSSFYNDPNKQNDPDFPEDNNTYNFTVFLKTHTIPVTTACIDTFCEYKPGGFTPGEQIVSVPEAESALVPVLALGFGYLYRSKKRKKLQGVATPEQERSLV